MNGFWYLVTQSWGKKTLKYLSKCILQELYSLSTTIFSELEEQIFVLIQSVFCKFSKCKNATNIHMKKHINCY